MENRKQLIEKELKLEKENIQKEIERLEKERENYTFDKNYMKKQLKELNYIQAITFSFTSLLFFLGEPWFSIGLAYSIQLDTAVVNTIQYLMKKVHNKKNNSSKLIFFSNYDELSNCYENLLNINLKIEQLNIKNKIIEKTIEKNKEDYRIINDNLINDKNNHEVIELTNLKNVIENTPLTQDKNQRKSLYSNTLIRNLIFKFGGFAALLVATFNPIDVALQLSGISVTASLFLSTLINMFESSNQENASVKIKKEFTYKNLASISKTKDIKKYLEKGKYLEKEEDIIREIQTQIKNIDFDDLIPNIIEEEAYKMLDEYNKNVESIIRQRKIDEYYKKKEEITRYLNSNSKENKIEKSKVKVLQKI